MIYAFATIAGLTLILVLMNTHEVVVRFIRDRDIARMLMYLTTLIFVGAFLINVAYRLVDKAIESAEYLKVSSNISE